MKTTVTVILSLLFTFDMFAAHIIGGEWSYTCLGNGIYDMKITIYRDCSNDEGAFFDQSIPIAVYRGEGASAVLVDNFEESFDGFENLEITQSNP